MAYEFEEELEDELEDELEEEDELEDELGLEGEGWLSTIGNIAGSLLGEGEEEDELEDEEEFEDEFEAEFEDELSPIRKVYADAMMEHLGELASEAETEEEAAEHFLPLIGMAASKLLPVVAKAVAPAAKKLLPKIARAVTRATPHLTKGIAKVARQLHRSPQKRHLLKVVPAIARRAVGSVARQAAHGRRITPHGAVRTLARQARRVLTHPAHRKQALRHHRRLEHKFHRHLGKGAVHPHYAMGRGRRLHTGHPYRYVRGRRVYAPGVRHGVPGRAATGAAPGAIRRKGVAIHPRTGMAIHPQTGVPIRYGQVVGGQCQCAPCPSCGTVTAPVAAVPAPAYCRCCGQVIR